MYDNFLSDVKSLSVYKTLYGAELDNIELGKLTNLPILNKDQLKSTFPVQWITEKMKADMSNDKTEINTTSGTSGKQLQIIRKKNWWQYEYARMAKLNPLLKEVFIDKKHRAVLTTTICSNTFCSRTAIHYENRVFGNILHMNITPNPVDWQEKDIQRMCEEWNRFKPYNLDADPVYLAIFLHYKEKYGIDIELHQPGFITFTYEYCPRSIYRLIKNYFNVPIIQLYGSTELGFLYYREVENGSYKIFPEYIDVSFKQVDKTERLYELIVTSAKNEYMPLVRYQTGDLVKIKEGFEQFVDTDPMRVELEDVCGRHGDMQWVNDKPVSIADLDRLVFKNSSNVFLYRVFTDKDTIYFHYTTKTALMDEEKRKLEIALKQLFQRDKFNFVYCESIDPLSSGKFQLLGAL